MTETQKTRGRDAGGEVRPMIRRAIGATLCALTIGSLLWFLVVTAGPVK